MFSNKANVEDFIWAIRQRHENIKAEELKAKTPFYNEEKKKSGDGEIVEEKSKILASLVPDVVLQNVNDYSHKNYNTCLLFGDVSGYTELTEKYNQEGKGGPSRLTLVLNGYLGALVQEIMSYGGDIFKFSGDAFLAIWKCKDEHQIMREYIHQALDCALVIQKNYGTFETDVGTLLRIKLAISAGPIIFSLIGNEKYSHYIVVGKPIYDVKDAEKRSKPGEIIVASSAWYHVNTADYIFEEMDGMFWKVLGVGPGWRHIKGENKYSVLSAEDNTEIVDMEEDSDINITIKDKELAAHKKNVEFTLRPTMHHIVTARKNLKKFILPPVMSCIDGNEPLEYLTEMRRAVIMFINITSKRSSYEVTASLVNECYILICKCAEKYLGCVNKVSLFDKDIMFVIIFGLRGFKHALESQHALKCAASIFEKLNSHKTLKTISIACTTGKTYCGIVGHTLRREYTVMGLIVNKAARIMVNYPDRIACDSATFQHSKLEASNFILQVYKPLKGISNPGPIYEFQELEAKLQVKQSVHSISFYPILGRTGEVQEYIDCFNAFVLNAERVTEKLPSYTRMLVVRGWPRQGKTRLVEEFLFQINDTIRVAKFQLSQRTSTAKYGITKLLMNKILQLDDDIPNDVLMRKLVILTQGCSDKHLCALNDIFGVNFEISEEYRNMTGKKQDHVMLRVLKCVCYQGLRSKMIIVIERVEYIDEGSWKLLLSLLACRLIFFIFTLDAFHRVRPMQQKIMDHKNVKVIELTNVHKQYHAGLACQILNVFAISADLENLLHERSNGNPGWIETLLISLKQSHLLTIQNGTYKTIDECGLVAPPLYMMRRMSEKNIQKWKQIMEEKNLDGQEITNDNWYIYIDICRDQGVNVAMQETIGETISKAKGLPLCFLDPKCNFNDIDAELSKEGMLIMTFDSLSYREQLLLKCSSVLGDSFPRVAMQYILQSDSIRDTAVVIQSLFEKRVLCCAKGDFSDGGSYLLIRDNMQDPTSETNIIACSCVGMYIHEDIEDLPKYASCGYIRFSSSKFRETTYNLLTDSQLKMFHARAAKYMLRETKQCSSCGGAYFDLDQYCKVDVHRTPRTLRRSNPSQEHSELSLSGHGQLANDKSELSSGTGHFKKSYGMSIIGKSMGRSLGASVGSSTFGHITFDDEEEDTMFNTTFGSFNPFKVYQYKADLSLTKPFSSVDFQSCHCLNILSYLHNQLRYHYKGAGQWLEMINATKDYVMICISQRNYTEALKSVKKAMEFLQTSGDTLGVPDWKIPIWEAKFYIWYGNILESQDQCKEALKALLMAMKKFGYPFPTNKLSLHINLLTKKLKQRLSLCLFPDKMLDKNLNEEDIDVVDCISLCLKRLFDIYMKMGKMKQAELCAIWSLTKALEAGTSLFQVCFAFGDMMLIANHKKDNFWRVVLEVQALRFCHKKKYGLDPPELQAIVSLYHKIFEIRLARAEYDASLHMGYILTRLVESTRNEKLLTKIYSNIATILIMKLCLTECLTIMQEMSFHVIQMESLVSKAEYYSCALRYHLFTGYNFLPFKEIAKYYRAECMLKPSPEQRQVLTLLRMWYSHTYQWEAAKIVNDQIQLVAPMSSVIETSIQWRSCMQMLFDVEYYLMLLVRMINNRNIYGKQDVKSKIAELFKGIDKNISRVPSIKPSYLQLKAYEAMIWSNEAKMMKYLKKARKFAVEQGNVLEDKRIEFLEQFWLDKLPDDEAQLWLKHAEVDSYQEYSTLDNGNYIMCYPLPLPIFY